MISKTYDWKKLATKVYNWEELHEYIQKYHAGRDIFIDVERGYGRITIGGDYHYLNTHTFYGKGDLNGINQTPTKILQKYGINVEIMGDGIC